MFVSFWAVNLVQLVDREFGRCVVLSVLWGWTDADGVPVLCEGALR
jgi:hypothetical protein